MLPRTRQKNGCLRAQIPVCGVVLWYAVKYCLSVRTNFTLVQLGVKIIEESWVELFRGHISLCDVSPFLSVTTYRISPQRF